MVGAGCQAMPASLWIAGAAWRDGGLASTGRQSGGRMLGQPMTQLQVSADRFVTRRIERALLSGQARSAREPLPTRSALATGCVATAVAVAACALLAFAQPQPVLDGAPILMGRRSGALYVRVGNTLHPVFNLASARLIAATADDPRPVRESDLGRAERGPLLGIPGAPQLLGTAFADPPTWSVCDTAGAAAPTTTVVVGADPPENERLNPEQAVPVTAGPGGETYLLYRGRRMLAPAGLTPRRVSGLLLNAVPEAPVELPKLPDRVAALPDDTSTLCVHWSRRSAGQVDVTVSAGGRLPLPAGAAPVTLARADGAGPALDAVYLPPGRSAYVRSIGISGQTGGSRYLVTDTGVRFAIGDDDAAHSLGLPPAPVPAPWPVLVGLPAGPQLSRERALIARDVVATGG